MGHIQDGRAAGGGKNRLNDVAELLNLNERWNCPTPRLVK